MDIKESRVNMLSVAVMRKMKDGVMWSVFDKILCKYGVSIYSDIFKYEGSDRFLEVLNHHLYNLYQIAEVEYNKLRQEIIEILSLTY